ncbi:hypothetical protein RHSIM_Rhsim02G0011700 [Rhododendron simsii]|uniref:Cullin N-terminal domain-containing protein n=1 Tax=Rhododendron simsii TaxID=118357 RepID=A0A834HAF6_RHOSS|nr:hypothetical protein RHSIM_Rhsim02G0011700 [Rhododendron simsii]
MLLQNLNSDLFRVVYKMCQPHPTGPECQKLNNRHKKIGRECIAILEEKNDVNLLQGLVKRWNMYKDLTRWLARFFHHLDRYFVGVCKLPTMNATSFLTFYELVYGNMNDQVWDFLLSMIDRERQGEQIDQALVKSVLDIYVEIGEGSTREYYGKDFEEAMLKDATSFYTKKASVWIASLSYKDYVLKVILLVLYVLVNSFSEQFSKPVFRRK